MQLIVKAHDILGHHITTTSLLNPSYLPLNPAEDPTSFPANNNWQANSNPGDNWTGSQNPFGPKVPLGAHGANGSTPGQSGFGGWASGECNFNGQAQCGMGPAPAVSTAGGNPYGVVAPPASGVGSGNLLNTGNLVNPWAQEVSHA